MTEIPSDLVTIIHIGAGQGAELPTYMASKAQKIVLVEPNPTRAAQLREAARNAPRVQVMEVAVTDNPELNQLNEYNLPEAASLYQSTGLRQLFPGLRILSRHPVEARTPDELLSQCSLEGERNLLVVQAPGAELSIIKALVDTDYLRYLSHIWVTSPREPYYEGAGCVDDILAELKHYGYDLREEQSANPDWPQWRLSRDPVMRRVQALEGERRALIEALQQSEEKFEHAQAGLNRVQAERAEARKDFDRWQSSWQSEKKVLTAELEDVQQRTSRLEEKAQRLELLNKELADAKAQADKDAAELTRELKVAQEERDQNRSIRNQQQRELQEARSAAEARQKELHGLGVKHGEAQKRAEQLADKVRKLEQRLAAEQGNQQQLNELAKKIDYLFGQQSLQLEQAANALGRHVTETVSHSSDELEASFRLAQQYGENLGSLEERGSRLPATVALQISHQLKSKSYDLIIEMGSGVTTSFLAHTLGNQYQNPSSDAPGGKSASRYIEPSEDDLPKRIICFEHNRAHFKALQKSLEQRGLTPILNLHYAPLVHYQYQDKEYLYYDCGARLQQVATLFENREAKIFVLLNDTDSDGRPDLSVALPRLLQHLSAHTLDLVINSAEPRSDLVAQWHALLESRGLDYLPATEFGNHTAQLIKVNP